MIAALLVSKNPWLLLLRRQSDSEREGTIAAMLTSEHVQCLRVPTMGSAFPVGFFPALSWRGEMLCSMADNENENTFHVLFSSAENLGEMGLKSLGQRES